MMHRCCILTNIMLLLVNFLGIDGLRRETPCSWDFCDVNAICTDLPGYQYSCECKPGYTGNGRYCKWRSTLPEPCASNLCHSNAYCRNVGDSYFCSCKEGYVGDGKTCTSTFAEPCASNPCHSNAACANLGISYSCSCNEGYFGDGKSCIGIFPEPCASNPCHSNATCTNRGITYFCTCKRGYVGDGKTCTEYVEPLNVKKVLGLSPSRCSPWILKHNQEYFVGNCRLRRDVGDWCCVRCEENYRFYGTSKRLFEIKCTNDREIAWSPSRIPRCQSKSPCSSGPCHAKADCRNIRSAFHTTYKCTCKQDYTGNGRICTPISPCSSSPCHANADCRDVSTGSKTTFRCTCKRGHGGNGRVCTPITCSKATVAKYKGYSVSACPGGKTVGSNCELKCIKGYKLNDTSNSKTAICTLGEGADSATWGLDKFPTCIEITCDDLILKPNQITEIFGCGFFPFETYPVGSRCTVECERNYKFENSNRKSYDTQCQLEANGSSTAIWSSIPDCIAITCSKEALTDDGHYSISSCPGGETIGAKCVLQCMDGYKFSDDSISQTAFCTLSDQEDSATWRLDIIPKCIQITCDDLILKPNQISDIFACGFFPFGTYHPVGSRCTVECERNYKFVNSNRKSYDTQCQLEASGSSTAIWSSIPDCIAITCSKEALTDDGHYSISSCPGGETIGAKCVLQCMDGYKFSDDLISQTAFCTLSDQEDSATWRLDIIPKCIPITCSEEALTDDGHYSLSSCPGGETIGAKCVLQCMDGYKFSDDSISQTAFCTLSDQEDSATWRLDTIPKCIQITCRKPILKTNQEFVNCPSSSTHHVGSTCTVQCRKNYIFSNSNRRFYDVQCQLESGSSTATWSTIPDCIGTSCNFETGLCHWKQDLTDDFDWERTTGSTPSRNTGPTGDHTTTSGYYLFIEATSPRRPGHSARLISPKLPMGLYCLKMWYHMYGDNMGSLLVKQITGKTVTTLVEKSGNKGNNWLYLEQNVHTPAIILSPRPGDYIQIVIEGVRGSTYRGDLAIDDITAVPNSLCTRQDWPWTEWGQCSVSCGGGLQTRLKKSCASSGICSNDTESRECNYHSCPECSGEWTTWFDRDDPTGSGDYEDLASLRKERKLDVCISPNLVDGRVVRLHTNWYQAGNNLTVASSRGLTCVNGNQKNGTRCMDYEVRFCCPKIENREEVLFVGETFLRTVLTISGGSSAGTSRRTDDATESNCKKRTYFDSSNNIKMLGKDCRSGRRKRQAIPVGPVIMRRDVLFLIDESGSVGNFHFQTFKRLAQAFVNSFCGDIDIAENMTRVGVLSFDETQHVQLNFSTIFKKALLLDAIEDISYEADTAGHTCLIPSLEYVRKSMFTPARGARITQPGTEQVLILFTDGCANCKPLEERPRLLKTLGDSFTQQSVSIVTYLVAENKSSCIQEIDPFIDGAHCYQGFVSENWDHVDLHIDKIEATSCSKSWMLTPPC